MTIHRDPALDEQAPVFADRAAGGRALTRPLEALELRDPVVLAVPAGGVPVAVEIARATGWPIDVAVVSKITLPWNTEAGYGAVAWDGTVRLNEPLVRQLGLDEATTREGTQKTLMKVERRKRRLRGGEGAPQVRDRSAILVDDGLASGFTMQVAIEATRRGGAASVIVATPTGHAAAVERLAELSDEVVCPNVRRATPFAVAAAYERWADVPEVVADELLRPFRPGRDRPWAQD